MSDVRCTGKGCKGANHVPGCEIYKAAMTAFDSRDRRTEEQAAHKERRRIRDAQRDHHKKPADQLLTPEQRGERIKSGPVPPGRKLGYKPPLPWGAVHALNTRSFNVREEFKTDDDVRDLAALTLSQMTRVIAGEVGPKKAPSILRGIIQLRGEICNPVVTEAKFTGTVSLESQVLAAAKLAAERRNKK